MKTELKTTISDFTIGLIGGGQLGKMLAIEAQKLGFEVMVLDPDKTAPAMQVVRNTIYGELDDLECLTELLDNNNFITYETENIDIEKLKLLAPKYPEKLNSIIKKLSIVQDKYLQKEFLAKNGFNVGNFCEIKSLNDIHDFADKHGFPVILKSRKGGYDGRGNYVINRKSSIFPAVDYLSDYGDISHLYCEEQIDFKMEISVLVAKCKSGSIVAYTVTETIQENGICVETITPARLDQYTMGRAYKTARDAIELFDGVGVFAVEMFVTQSGEIVINEISTRVHNSGHWTIEGADTSQFLQHIRLTVGCDIGDTGTKYNCVVMKNILGTGSENEEYDLTKMRKILSFQNSYLHLYGKREWRKNRKMGHITLTCDSLEQVKKFIMRLS